MWTWGRSSFSQRGRPLECRDRLIESAVSNCILYQAVPQLIIYSCWFVICLSILIPRGVLDIFLMPFLSARWKPLFTWRHARWVAPILAFMTCSAQLYGYGQASRPAKSATLNATCGFLQYYNVDQRSRFVSMIKRTHPTSLKEISVIFQQYALKFKLVKYQIIKLIIS